MECVVENVPYPTYTKQLAYMYHAPDVCVYNWSPPALSRASPALAVPGDGVIREIYKC